MDRRTSPQKPKENVWFWFFGRFASNLGKLLHLPPYAFAAVAPWFSICRSPRFWLNGCMTSWMDWVGMNGLDWDEMDRIGLGGIGWGGTGWVGMDGKMDGWIALQWMDFGGMGCDRRTLGWITGVDWTGLD